MLSTAIDAEHIERTHNSFSPIFPEVPGKTTKAAEDNLKESAVLFRRYIEIGIVKVRESFHTLVSVITSYAP